MSNFTHALNQKHIYKYGCLTLINFHGWLPVFGIYHRQRNLEKGRFQFMDLTISREVFTSGAENPRRSTVFVYQTWVSLVLPSLGTHHRAPACCSINDLYRLNVVWLDVRWDLSKH